jgi:WD40 repeat protein
MLVRWAPDGKYITSGGLDGSVLVWTASDGKTHLSARSTVQPPINPDYVWSVDWLQKKGVAQFAVSFTDGTMQTLDANNNQRLTTFGHNPSPLSVLSWAPNGQYIAAGRTDNSVIIYAYPSWNVVTTYQDHTDSVKAVAWSPDGTLVASASADTTVRLWDPVSGQTKVRCIGHTDAVMMVSWSYDSKRIVSTSSDGTARVWDVTNQQAALVYHKPGGAPGGEAVWSHSDRYLAVYGGNGILYILNAQTLQQVKQIPTSVAFSQSWSPDDTRIVTGYDKVAYVWQVNM